MKPQYLKWALDRQARATIREWEEAMEDGNYALAQRIARANPDLFPFAIASEPES
jgi:hypothetical protein